MNCPSRADPEALVHEGWNQSPPALALDKNNDSNGIANLRQQRDHRTPSDSSLEADTIDPGGGEEPRRPPRVVALRRRSTRTLHNVEGAYSISEKSDEANNAVNAAPVSGDEDPGPPTNSRSFVVGAMTKAWKGFLKFLRFVGPGFMVSVAYIDPGNYATDVAAGASYRFQLLVMVLVSNIIAIFLQALCIRLGSVTGMNLAEAIHTHCPPWLNYALYFFGEGAIIATDMAEVIGTAIALNLLINVPLVAGCAISIVDVLIILIFYKPSGTVRGLRYFEFFVILLVMGVVICFCIELSMIQVPNVGELFRGYLPSSALVQSKGLYQACGILGATVMPHSLYLGSGIVQPRLREYDEANGNIPTPPASAASSPSRSPSPEATKYRPTLAAIRFCLNTSIAELAISLFTFALFVNSAILIVAGASLSHLPSASTASLFSIHDLLSRTLAPAAGTIFALALLLSGTSAGVICTIAGQMVSEGQLRLSMRPWLRRLLTRSISITPSIIIAGAVGQAGLSTALVASQVALSVALPFTSAPLIYFTARNRYMTLHAAGPDGADVGMRNHRVVTAFAAAMWLLIVVMNVALLVLAAMGKN